MERGLSIGATVGGGTDAGADLANEVGGVWTAPVAVVLR